MTAYDLTQVPDSAKGRAPNSPTTNGVPTMNIYRMIEADRDRDEAYYVDWETQTATYLVTDPEPLDPRIEWGADEDSPDTEDYIAGEVYGIITVQWSDTTDDTATMTHVAQDCWGFYGWDFAKDEAHTQHDYWVSNPEGKVA